MDLNRVLVMLEETFNYFFTAIHQSSVCAFVNLFYLVFVELSL